MELDEITQGGSLERGDEGWANIQSLRKSFQWDDASWIAMGKVFPEEGNAGKLRNVMAKKWPPD